MRRVQWVRVAQTDDWMRFLAHLPASNADALEISPQEGGSLWGDVGFRSYSSVQFPAFDITTQILDKHFDVIIAEQVFEHLRDPYSAARNICSMLKDDGTFLIATPFLIRIHNYPGDYLRWTPQGLQVFLNVCGFDADVKSWGNRRAIVANFDEWPVYNWWRSMNSEPELPAVVWAFARKRARAA
jgi:SAM-dependent methyltransferase